MTHKDNSEGYPLIAILYVLIACLMALIANTVSSNVGVIVSSIVFGVPIAYVIVSIVNRKG